MSLTSAFAPVAFILAVLVLIPLPSYARSGNAAVISLIAWLFVLDLIYAVDAIVWAHSPVYATARVWCDISSKIVLGFNYALPACCFSLCLYLERAASGRKLMNQRPRQLLECILCLGVPAVFMALHTIVQDHRYDLIEGIGCRPSTYFSIPAIFIVWLPPFVLVLATIVLTVLAFRHVFKNPMLAQTLELSPTPLSRTHFMRLLVTLAVLISWFIALFSYSLSVEVKFNRLQKWTNWQSLHAAFSNVVVYSEADAPNGFLYSAYVIWWMVPVSAILFLLGTLNAEVVEEYQRFVPWLRSLASKHTVPEDMNEKGMPTMVCTKKGPLRQLRLSAIPRQASTVVPINAYSATDLGSMKFETRSSISSMSTGSYDSDARDVDLAALPPTPSTLCSAITPALDSSRREIVPQSPLAMAL